MMPDLKLIYEFLDAPYPEYQINQTEADREKKNLSRSTVNNLSQARAQFFHETRALIEQISWLTS